jgi:hypothetical protein
VGDIYSYPSISSHDESDQPLFIFILSQFYARGCRVGAFKFCCFLFHDIHLALKIFMTDNSTVDSLVLFPFSSSHVLSVSIYLLSGISMITASNIGGLTYLHLHLYPHMTNLTNRCSFPYLDNFMVVVVGLALSNSATSCSVIYIMHSNLS